MVTFSADVQGCAPPPCRVLIADDHALFRTCLRTFLESKPGITVVAEAKDGEEALAQIAELSPAVALVDLRMPKLNGIAVARSVAQSSQRTAC